MSFFGVSNVLMLNIVLSPSKTIGLIIFGQQGPTNIFLTFKYIKLKICEIVDELHSDKNMLTLFSKLSNFGEKVSIILYKTEKSKNELTFQKLLL